MRGRSRPPILRSRRGGAAAASGLSYVRGPVGVAVLLDGKPYGVIKDVRRHGGWLVSIPGFHPGLEGVAEAFKGKHVFKTLAAAKAEVNRRVKTRS